MFALPSLQCPTAEYDTLVPPSISGVPTCRTFAENPSGATVPHAEPQSMPAVPNGRLAQQCSKVWIGTS